jgi:hypothetical protein
MGFTPFHYGFGVMHFQVDGTLAEEAPPADPPPSAVPEPATLTLMLAGLVVGRRRLRARG